MAIERSGGINAQAEGSNLKTPDYHLPYTGEQVTAAIQKIMELNMAGVGGISKVESTEGAPANIDTMTTPGNYIVDYASGSTFPTELQGYKPINVTVYAQKNADGTTTLYQIVEAGGMKYSRWSKDNGATWSQFAPMPTNVGAGDISGANPSDPPAKDPITVLEEKNTTQDTAIQQNTQAITNLTNSLGDVSRNALKLGSAEIGQQIINGTFDYDTTIS